MEEQRMHQKTPEAKGKWRGGTHTRKEPTARKSSVAAKDRVKKAPERKGGQRKEISNRQCFKCTKKQRMMSAERKG